MLGFISLIGGESGEESKLLGAFGPVFACKLLWILAVACITGCFATFRGEHAISENTTHGALGKSSGSELKVRAVAQKLQGPFPRQLRAVTSTKSIGRH
jgi:hypothetical protein